MVDRRSGRHRRQLSFVHPARSGRSRQSGQRVHAVVFGERLTTNTDRVERLAVRFLRASQTDHRPLPGVLGMLEASLETRPVSMGPRSEQRCSPRLHQQARTRRFGPRVGARRHRALWGGCGACLSPMDQTRDPPTNSTGTATNATARTTWQHSHSFTSRSKPQVDSTLRPTATESGWERRRLRGHSETSSQQSQPT